MISNSLKKPHDAYLKAILEDKENRKALVSRFFPKKLVAEMNLDKAKLSKTSFITMN